MDQDIETKPVDLEAPDLVAALDAKDGPAVRAALKRQGGAGLLDLRDAQRGITRRKRTAAQRAAFEESIAADQARAALFYGSR